MTLKIGDIAPNFELPVDNGAVASLGDYVGRMLVLYFYPKDDTPGCTKQACGFRDNLKDFENLNAAVLGISKDSLKKHEKFTSKYELNFPLASDEAGQTCEDYGVWKEKSMYGKTYMGIERTTFLIDENGKIAAIWNKVKVADHIDDVRSALEKLKKAA